MDLIEAYNEIYSNQYNLTEDLTDLIIQYCIEDIEEAKSFAEDLVLTNLVQDFLFELSEELEVDISEYLVEGAGSTALRGIINALSSAGRTKAGLQAGTALGKKLDSTVRGAAASTSIRSARAARPKSSQELPGKYATMQFKKKIDTALSRPALPPGRSSVPPQRPSGKRTPADAGMPFRATGAGGDARIQRLSAQAAPGSGLNPAALKTQTSKMTDAADALNKARRALAGVAAAGLAASSVVPVINDTEKKKSPESSVNKYNTKDSGGKIRSRLKVGPKIVGTGSIAGDFDAAFKKARSSGAKSFKFQGKQYTTKLKTEEVDYFDVVLETLIAEGYVDSIEDALIMMTALDENIISKIASGAIKNVIKTGADKLTKTKLPPKMDPALKAVKDSIKQQYGSGALMGTPEYRYAKAARQAELRKNPPPKPKYVDPFPGDVYSRGDFGIRGYRSGD